MTADAFGGTPGTAVNAAVGVEMFHNFTLLHDDVMDRSELRRSRPTAHSKWDTNTAILSGDTMLTLMRICSKSARHGAAPCLRHVQPHGHTGI